MKQLIYSITIILILLSCSEKKDYRKQLDRLDKEHQSCLDKGEQMMNCSYQYSKQMDSMLNVVYKDLMMHYDDGTEKDGLIIEERRWMKKRDMKLKSIYSNINKQREKGEWVPQDDRMIAYDKEAKLIRKRVIELIDKFERKTKRKTHT